jgi:hypothetical protein
VEWLARFGFVAKGVVYGLLGIMALQVAFNSGGQAPGTEDALQTIAQQPFGQLLIGLVAVGLVGYSIWLFIRAGMDADREGSDMKGLAKRAGFAVAGIVYLGLAFVAAQLALGSGGQGGGDSAASWTAQVMQQPFGRWLVGLAGLAVVVAGLFRLYQAYNIKFRQELNLDEMDSNERKWIIRFGRAGLAAQGVVLAMIGGFLVQAAIQAQPSEARGLGGALQTLLEQPFGPWLLGIVALGLLAHGIYMFILARYRRIRVS